MASESAIAILCASFWEVQLGGHLIQFNRDGTGKLFCICELSCYIAAETEWKLVGPGSHAVRSTVNPTTIATATANTGADVKGINFKGPAQFSIEMTLTRCVATLSESSMEGRQLNEHWLTDEAFSPKKYKLTLDDGHFVVDKSYYHQYHLTFDPSPFPPRDQWRNSHGYHVAAEIWTVRQFYASLQKRPEGFDAQSCAVM